MKIDITRILGRKEHSHRLVLAGDIGGTKTTLGYFSLKGDILSSQELRTFPSAQYSNFESILKAFIKGHSDKVQAACFGIAGPVTNGICRTTNLPWLVNAAKLKSILKIQAVMLINDMEATAYGIQALPKTAFATLNQGSPQAHGNIAVLAAGTGLGEGMLFWDGQRYRAVASEGGHADFAPCNPLELDLCRFLLKKFGHSSYERVLSGPGLFNIYTFLKNKNLGQPEPSWLKKELKEDDPGTIIAQNALIGRSRRCEKALELFCAIYGAEAGNLALKTLARGGVYLGGGIAPKILSKLKDGTFKKAFLNKGRISKILSRLPVQVILEEKTALYGAAINAMQFT